MQGGTCAIREGGPHCEWCQDPEHADWRASVGASLPCGDKRGPWRANEPPGPKPGTELKRLLAVSKIVAGPTCGCNAMAAKMDAWGSACGLHLDEIVAVMEAEAHLRGWKLPGMRFGMRGLVRLAIRRARQKSEL